MDNVNSSDPPTQVLLRPEFQAGVEPIAIPKPQLPADGAELRTPDPGPLNVEFTWAPGPDLHPFEVQISLDSRFAWIHRSIVTGDATRASTGLVPAPGSYYWRVRAVTAVGAGPWSDIREFSIVHQPAPAHPADKPESRFRRAITKITKKFRREQ